MTLIIIIWVVFGAVGAVIDGIRGFLWGFILGPVGWIIAAILKSKSQDQETHTTTSNHSITRDSASRVAGSSEEHHQDNGQFDRRRWEILKEVDQDIRQASEAVVKVHPSLDDELAEKYMVLNQKDYLQALVDKIVLQKTSELEHDAEVSRQFGNRYPDAAQEIRGYRKTLSESGFDHRFFANVLEVEVYNGSWAAWRGGMAIHFEDGRTVLRKGGLERVFLTRENQWK